MALEIDENLSKRINSLRFLLIVLVVFIHNNVTTMNFAGGTEIYEIPVYVAKIRYVISNIMAGIAVPLFFLISGFLLYAKETTFITVLKKKNRTILLPYVIWNILSVLFFFTAQHFSFTKMYFANPQNIIRNFGWLDWIDVFLGKFIRSPYPLVYQFWFLRDLFILDILFVVIKKIIDTFPFGTFIILCLLWIAGINIYIVSTEALLFFALGYYIVKYALSYKTIDSIKIQDIVILYIITITIELFLPKSVPMIHKINIIVGSILCIKSTCYFIHNKKLYTVLTRLEKHAFFVYAIHEPLLTIMKKLSVRIIPMHGGWILLQYFGIALLGIVVFLGISIVVRKIFPKMYVILTGGRG